MTDSERDQRHFDACRVLVLARQVGEEGKQWVGLQVREVKARRRLVRLPLSELLKRFEPVHLNETGESDYGSWRQRVYHGMYFADG